MKSESKVHNLSSKIFVRISRPVELINDASLIRKFRGFNLNDVNNVARPVGTTLKSH